MNRFSRFLALGVALLAGGATLWVGGATARANTLPASSTLQFQTSSPTRIPGIGDWYTTQTSASTDRVHRILVEVSQALLDANGGTVNVQVFDADCYGNLDEVTGAGDPARFELRASNGTTVLQSQIVPSGTSDGVTLSFPISAPGSYQLVIVNGGSAVGSAGVPSGATATDTTYNDDDNTYSVSIPGNSTLIGQFQGTFSPTTAVSALNFYFLVGPGQANLRLRNFDLDSNGSAPSVTYTRPSGATIAGTASGNGVWNNSGSLNAGEDTVSVAQSAPYADAGQWGLTVNTIGSGNQFALEANSGTQRLVLLDQPPGTADAGNFAITPDSTLRGSIGTPSDHPFSVTNYFFTNDIINLSLSGTAVGYTTQLFDASTNTALTDSDNDGKVDTGLMTPGQTKNFYLRVIPQTGVAGNDTTRINATSFMDTRVAPAVVTTQFVSKTTQLSSATNVSGTVYADNNHNGTLDSSEGGLALSGYYVKLVPAAGGSALFAVAVNASSGTYQFLGIVPGSYTLVLDDNATLTDTTPAPPPSTSGTEAGNATRAAVVPLAGLINQNFGRYAGISVAGRVFADAGTSSGTPNDGTLNGGESGIAGVTVRLQNSGGTTTYDTATTDASGAYLLYAPATGTALRVIETNAPSYRTTGGSPGTTGGAYASATDATTFTPVAGAAYTGVNFGDVPPSLFTNDNVRTAASGETVLVPHVFTAGTAGSLAFTLSATANPTSGWSNVLYLDANADGVLQSNETPITAPLNVTAGQQIAVLVKTFTPLGAPQNSRQALQIAAALTYANAGSLVETLTRSDVVTIAAGSGLSLVKSVDKATAKAGDDITYTITYRNEGNDTLSSLVINDFTPAFTVFRSGATSALPTGLSAVATAFPNLNAAGPLKWTFTGALSPGRSGSVSFVVRLQ